MSNIQSEYNNYVNYTLYSNKKSRSQPMANEPGNWSNDNIILDRHKDYHGIFFSFSEGLVFYEDDMDYILSVYNDGDINANLYLRKDVLKNVDGDLKFVYRYITLADFNTLDIFENSISLNFNSNNLTELMKSHETDDFEIDRNDSIDGEILEKINETYTEIKGRSLESVSESILNDEGRRAVGSDNLALAYTPLTKVVGTSDERITPVQSFFYDTTGGQYELTVLNMFYDNSVENVQDSTVTIKYDIEFNLKEERYTQAQGILYFKSMNIEFVKYTYNEGTASYVETEVQNIFSKNTVDDFEEFTLINEVSFEVSKNDALLIRYIGNNIALNKQVLRFSTVSYFDPSPKLRFAFVHDTLSRLMYILTGRQDAFYSKYYGRTELDDYKFDGEGGLIGIISGLWIRAFDPDSTNYKSLTTSIKDVLTSVKAISNVGVTVETKDFKERLRVEDLKYFYRNEVVVRFPNQMNNIVRKVDSSLFFSALEFGYERGGDYDNAIGLDEPNTRTNFVSPIRKSKNKFKRLSKIRTDDTGMEIARRKPQSSFLNEDTRYDESNFFLDLKRTEGINYTQKDYTDRAELNELGDPILPINIHSPETYKGMYFSPVQMLLRHAWVFRSGLEKYLDKSIKYINAKSNSALVTWMRGNHRSFAENGDIVVNELERSRFLPQLITCEYDIDDDIMDWILGSTEVVDDNGEKEMVPNYYFKMQILNDKNETENVYLLSLKPGSNGKLEFLKSNENLI